MDEVGLFLSLAQIAGVFVGIAALISVTRWSEIEDQRLGSLRAVVTTGLVVIVAALVPVLVAAFGITDDGLWFLSSLAFLALSWTIIVMAFRSAESRQLMVQQARARPVESAFYWILLEIPIQVPLILAVLGVFPDLRQAFYVTALVFNLFEAAFVLAQFVYARASDARW